MVDPIQITSTDIDNPTILDSNYKVTITPRQSNSKICITWTSQVRVSCIWVFRDMLAFINLQQSDMSSPSLVDGGSVITR